ncbi:MAG: UDP-glucose/GDP-mannose dehydrogenase family protein, partial [Actinomycetota bacterium]|nr:UDP-glucose/GDP-mannose dehydrogenase family protein [Actinomycetota bacterium]
GKTIAVLGISFKPDTDDVRDAPSITIMNSLSKMGAKIKAYDPVVKNRPETLTEKVKICNDEYEAIEGSDVLIIATEWEQFKELDFEKIRKIMNNNIIIDGRNFFEREELEKLGFKYIGIGR